MMNRFSKAQKTQKKSACPKAADYDDFGKELVVNVANVYHALPASRGPFPKAAAELKLIKKAWKLVNAETGVNSL